MQAKDDKVLTTLRLVKNLHDNPESNEPGYLVHLDPKAYEQVRQALGGDFWFDEEARGSLPMNELNLHVALESLQGFPKRWPEVENQALQEKLEALSADILKCKDLLRKAIKKAQKKRKVE